MLRPYDSFIHILLFLTIRGEQYRRSEGLHNEVVNAKARRACDKSLGHVWLFATLWTTQSLPGSSVCGILQARILELAAMRSSRGSSWRRDRTRLLRLLHCQAGSLPLACTPPWCNPNCVLEKGVSCSVYCLICKTGRLSVPALVQG